MELVAQLDDAGTRSADAVARLWRAGELSAKKDGIGVYKVPLCLAVSGQHTTVACRPMAAAVGVWYIAAERRRTFAALQPEILRLHLRLVKYASIFFNIAPSTQIIHLACIPIPLLVRMFCPNSYAVTCGSAELRLTAHGNRAACHQLTSSACPSPSESSKCSAFSLSRLPTCPRAPCVQPSQLVARRTPPQSP